jgi:ERCC4-type nuclease
MTKFLVSPAERPPITTLGTNSPLPERVGSDIIWQGAEGLAGCQRKAIPDLISSVHDNRLGREVGQMSKADLRYRFLVIEGQPSWDREGNLAGSRSRWSIRQHNGVLLSVQQQGIQVVSSRTSLETCAVIQHLYDWTQKKDHVSSLLAREKTPKNGWGQVDDKTTFVHFFSAVDDIKDKMAARIYDMYGNILTLTVGEEELFKVPGLGPKRVASILKTFGVVQQSSTRDGGS